MKQYIIRAERPEDYRAVENLIRESFWNVYMPGCTEHYVMHCYRNNPDFIPELDFVMEVEGQIIGQVMFSKAEILTKDNAIPAWTFGPICIAPQYKRKGYGLALLNYAVERARAYGIGILCMEGNYEFYKHAGFVLASNLGVHYHGMPEDDPVPFFLAQELIPGYMQGREGTYHTPQGYFVASNSPEEFERYDATFPYKEKQVLEGQIF